ncbi:hypothetical protein [Virgibacillus ihumii]|uniref:hypothetical protein n=1 Tax=Virgibacillus ihumii TaxID=2686091 RepID=UPI00157D254F|nr:hypothetical protein [Virgibacillus ihumii]
MKVKLILLSVIFAGISFILFQVLVDDNTAAISLEEAEAIAVGLYDGKAFKSEKNEKGNYIIAIENEKGIYQLTVNSHTKKVSNVKQLKEKTRSLLTIKEAKKNIQQQFKGNVLTIKKSGNTAAKAKVKKKNRTYQVIYDLKKGKITSSKTVKDSKKHTSEKQEGTSDKKKKSEISRNQLTNIAKKQLDGTVSNIKRLQTDHGIVYKVTVEKQTKGAHVYVQEATKKITSTSWFSKNTEVDDDSDDADDNEGSDDDDDSDDDSDDD